MNTNQGAKPSAATHHVDRPVVPSPVSQPGAVRLAWALSALSALLLALAVLLLVLNRDLGFRALSPHLLVVPGFAVVGLVLAVRRPSNAIGWIFTAIGLLAALVQFLGLVRWPFAVPHLARLAGDPATTPATRDTIEVVFQTLNRYLGVAVGEHLGYLFTGLWTALAGVALIQSDLLHPLFGVVGLVVAPLFVLGSLEFVGPFQIQRLGARRHPGPTRLYLYRMVGMAAGPWHRSAAHRLTLGPRRRRIGAARGSPASSSWITTSHLAIPDTPHVPRSWGHSPSS